MKPLSITNKDIFLIELMSTSSALYTGEGGSLLRGCDHAMEHLHNCISSIDRVDTVTSFRRNGRKVISPVDEMLEKSGIGVSDSERLQILIEVISNNPGLLEQVTIEIEKGGLLT